MRLLFPVVGLALAVSSAVLAAEPRFGLIGFSVNGHAVAQAVFTPDAPEIVLHVQLLDLPQGTKVTADWTVAKTDVVLPGFTLAFSEMEVGDGAGANEAAFKIMKPDAGWPLGEYKVKLSIDGRPVTSVFFKVAK
jgi:hypothetical protein